MMNARQQPSIAFGTDGIRGNAQQFPFTDQALYVLGRALALWARHTYQVAKPTILIGMDTRVSGPRIKKALVSGLTSQQAIVFDADVLSTPAVCNLVNSTDRFTAGIVISASHNLYQDNGVKVFGAGRCKMSASDEQLIKQYFDEQVLQGDDYNQSDFLIYEDFHQEARDLYQAQLLARFQPNFLSGTTVVLDCAHGATYRIAPAIFRALGATVYTVGTEPMGTNINDYCGSTHPELLVEAVLKHRADIGFAFDGDGDRIVAVNRHGAIKDGDDMVALLSTQPPYNEAQKVVGTVMSNQGLEAYLTSCGKQLVRTSVGDKYVAQSLEQEGLLLGGEPSGHIIMRDYLATGDGVFVALRILETIIATNNWDLESFNKFPQVLVNVPVAYKTSLDQQPFTNIIQHHAAQLGSGRLLVRYSGTEPVLRVMTEASQYDIAHEVAHELAVQLQQALSLASQTK